MLALLENFGERFDTFCAVEGVRQRHQGKEVSALRVLPQLNVYINKNNNNDFVANF